MSSRPEHVAKAAVSNSTEVAPVGWQLILSERPVGLRWWLVGATIWAQDERNPLAEVIVAPNVADLIQRLELGLRAARKMT